MTREQYEKTKDYTDALELFRNFVEEILAGEVEGLRTYCFDELLKFIGDIDPDMTLIMKAIYIILWGDIFDLRFENMGPWNMEGTYAFRGDTMNSFGSLIGKTSKEKDFAYRAKLFGADKDLELWSKIKEFEKTYHWVGNFIIIPNRSTIKYGINGARAFYYNTNDCEGMRDYFDWFLLAIKKYQDKIKSDDNHFTKFEMQLNRNQEYDPAFLEINKWEKRFFLEDYFENGQPKLLFCTPLKRRLLITAESQDRKGESYYQDQEYLNILRDYLLKATNVIKYRSNKIVDFLKKELQKDKAI